MIGVGQTELNVVGGHLALDLVNTVEPRVADRATGSEHLTTAAELLDWARRLEVVTTEEAGQVEVAWRSTGAADAALAASLEIREATYDVLLTALGPRGAGGAPALEVLHRHWSAAISRSTLSLPGDAVAGDRLVVGPDPATRVTDRLAHAAVDLLRTLDVEQLKTCPLEDGGCGWLFLDRSRNSSRRWCSMDDCGAKAKARRLTARRRRARSV